MKLSQRITPDLDKRSRRGRRAVLALTLAAVIGALAMGAEPASAHWEPVAVQAPLLGAAAKGVVPGSYLVVLKNQAGLQAAGVRTASSPAAGVSEAVARGRQAGAVVQFQYQHALAGYAATLNQAALSKVRADPAVAYVEANQVFHATGSTQKKPTWGLDRVDQRKLPLSKSYYYSDTGAGVTAYVVDTGIRSTHLDFTTDVNGQAIGSRVSGGTCTAQVDDVQKNCTNYGTADCDGHGTHVAGTIGGELFGVAKKVHLVPVRVLDCGGGGTAATVVAGLDWIVADHGTGPAVANMSLTGDVAKTGKSVGDAVKSVIADGVSVVVAAGNGKDSDHSKGVSACTQTPSDVKAAITVGASTSTDKKATFSDYGSCVDLYAPGQNITSDWYTADDEVAKLSGTSMATPHVTGAVALYLQNHPTATPATVQAAIIKAATPNKITGVSTKWPRRLLFALQAAKKPVATTVPGQISSGTALLSGQKVCSPNGLYCLTQRASDGLLVLQKPGSRKIWSAEKGGAAWTKVTTTGALTSYDAYGRPVWSSKTSGGPATLFVRDSGNLELVLNSSGKLLWSSGSTQKKAPAQAANSLSTLVANAALYRSGHKLLSPDGVFSLGLRKNGDLVLSKKLSATKSSTIWHSGVKDDDWLVVRATGDLELTRADGKVVWKTATTGKGVATLILKDSGNLALTRTSDKKILWSTKTSGA